MELPEKIFETDEVAVFSKVAVSQKEIEQLVDLCMRDGVSVASATYRGAYYRSMRPNANRQIVPFFQPVCFAIRKLVLFNLPFEYVAQIYPKSWGADIHWSIQIRRLGDIVATNLVIVNPGDDGGGVENPEMAKSEMLKTLAESFGRDWVQKYGKTNGFEESGWLPFMQGAGQKKKTCCGGR
jgi:hypothetical protein